MEKNAKIQDLYDKLARKGSIFLTVSMFCIYIAARLSMHGYPEFLSAYKDAINLSLGLGGFVSFLFGFVISLYLRGKAVGSYLVLFGLKSDPEKLSAGSLYLRKSYSLPFLFLIPAILLFEFILLITR